MSENTNIHYDDKYFAWQSTLGEFGGWANRSKFIEFISINDSVLDFGCGGGYLLKDIDCKKKIGIEINPVASSTATTNGVEVFSKTEDVPSEYADIIISNNALEHTLHPLTELKSLHRILKPKGRIIFVVPCESVSYKYRANDINRHLYSWSPMCIGNLFNEAGFQVIESKPYIHKWPRFYRFFAKLGGRKTFDLVCRIKGRLERSWFQVRVIACK